MKRVASVLLTLVFIVLLGLFALAVPNGRLTDDVINTYRNEQQVEDEDSSWLLNY